MLTTLIRAYEILLGTILGALLGWAARHVMKFAEKKKYIDRQSFVAQYVSLALLSMGKCSFSFLAFTRRMVKDE